MIALENLTRTFGGPPAVDDVTLAVPEGAFLVLLGPSGCGKSTLLRMLAGLDAPTAGRIRFGDTLVADGPRLSLPPEARGAGLVFQSYALWPHMSVAGNVDWPLKVAGLPRAARAARVAEALETVGIADLAERYPGEISGGQQQRVALARMIAPRPRIMLFDEPLSNLDAALRVEMRQELVRLHAATGTTTIYVTHDQVEAMTLATHVAVLDRGRVQQFGPPMALLDDPQTAFVARFVGTPPANLIPVREGAWFGRWPAAALTGRTGQAMVRAEEIGLSETPGPGRIPAERLEVIPMAGRRLVTGRVDGDRLTAVVGPGAAIPDRLYFVLPDRPSKIFPDESTPHP